MINGSVCHLLGLSLVNDGVKGRVISVRAGDYRTSVEVVTADGAFAQWLLSECTEAEPGALVRAIEEASERIDRILGKTKPAEPPPVEEPVVVDEIPPMSGPARLVWTQGTHPNTWSLGAEDGEAGYVSWSHIGPHSYVLGASKEEREADPGTPRNGCKTIAAWAREDGYIVPLHPVYGEV